MFSIPNLILADKIARRRKTKQKGVIIHDKRRGCNIITLHNQLMEKTYKTSTYKHFTLFDPKEREISALPYYPDRIVHHAIMLRLEPLFVSTFTADTYSCIKGRGIHKLSNKLKKALKKEPETQFCLKMDIKKFYPSVKHHIIKPMLERKIKDRDLLQLLFEIINSAPGLPIGNYLSQYFANFYLAYFDHWLKEVKRVKYYFRYADDMVILANSKIYLHRLFVDIKNYLWEKLELVIKKTHQVFPVKSRGVDVVGYKHFPWYTLLRPSIKRRFARMLTRNKTRASIAGYHGWAVHADTKHLLTKLLKPDEQIQRTGGAVKNAHRGENKHSRHF